jgi:hypothetical protein
MSYQPLPARAADACTPAFERVKILWRILIPRRPWSGRLEEPALAKAGDARR